MTARAHGESNNIAAIRSGVNIESPDNLASDIIIYDDPFIPPPTPPPLYGRKERLCDVAVMTWNSMIGFIRTFKQEQWIYSSIKSINYHYSNLMVNGWIVIIMLGASIVMGR